MATDEEYLDNLLKEMMEDNPDEDVVESNDIVVEDGVMPDAVAVDFDEQSDTAIGDEQPMEAIFIDEEKLQPEEVFQSEEVLQPEEILQPEEVVTKITSDELADMVDSLDEAFEAETGNEMPEPEENEYLLMQQDLDNMFAEMDAQINTEEKKEDSENETEAEEEIIGLDSEFEETPSEEFQLTSADLGDMDIDELLDGMGADEDLAEIKGLLDKAESNELIDDDMLGLLEGESEYGDNSEPEENEDLLELLNLKEKESDSDKKKDKKKKKKRFKGKKEETGEDIEQPEEEYALSELEELNQRSEKKTGFFARLISILTDTDEDESVKNQEIQSISDENQEIQSISDENQEILDELDAEDKKNKKKKEKKKKKGAKETESEETEEKEPKPEEEKPKKTKASKKKADNKEYFAVEKKVSKKKVLLVFVFCATLMSGIVMICSFLPDYMERREARIAYGKNDYKAVYDLLYNKNLSTSDELLLKQATVVLQMERKEKSHHNYKAMNMQPEALDALLQGVARYQILCADDLYGADVKVEEIYQEILDILVSDYNISEQEAYTILGYDNITYTKKVNSIVQGTDFEEPGMEDGTQAPDQLQDILPEEEDMM